MNSLILLVVALLILAQGANLSTKYAEKIAEGFKMSRYVIGFVVVSFVSILPETLIAINAALQGAPALGIGTIFGSNVIDLTLIMAILVFYAGKRGLKVEKGFTKKLLVYPLFLTVPLLLGMDGFYSREEGITLVIIGIIFYFFVFGGNLGGVRHKHKRDKGGRHVLAFLAGVAMLLVGAHFTTSAAVDLAVTLDVTPILIGVLIVSFGTTLPELFFSAKAVRQKNDALAVGNIMGTVLANATVVVGILAIIAPFSFPQTIAYVAGGFMVIASVGLVIYMYSQFRIVRREAVVLLAIWALYVAAELVVNQFTDASAAIYSVF